MKKFCYIVFLLTLLMACSKKSDLSVKNNIEANDPVETTKAVESITEEQETDCVFENKPYELTKEWLKEVGFEKFTWDKKNTKAIVILNQDTLLVYKGGCNHLMSSVEINIEKDTDILQKISDLACQFKFEKYCSKISKKQFEKIETNKHSYILEFEDDDPQDNLIYAGIEIKEKNKMAHVVISEYYN